MPHRTSSFGFKSRSKSRRSDTIINKPNSLVTKSNPLKAMNEAEPVADALESSNIGSLGQMRHLDMNGNPITEPDLSNPTRPRWERPLDTIRAFENAIDMGYNIKLSRANSTSEFGNINYNRRSSTFLGFDQGSRYSQVGGYYDARNSYYSEPRPSYRNQLGKHLNDERLMVRPHDAVLTSESGGSPSEPWGSSTNPSSENSSIERAAPSKSPGIYGQSELQMPERSHLDGDTAKSAMPYMPANGGYSPQSQFSPGRAVQETSPGPRNLIKLGDTNNSKSNNDSLESTKKKRRSWFKRSSKS